MLNAFLAWLRGKPRLSIGEQACLEAFDMLAASNAERKLLSKGGWLHVAPYMVNNEWLWLHPDWKYKTHSEALKIQLALNDIASNP